MKFSRNRIAVFLTLLFIIFLGAFFRLYRLPELSTFRSDQAIELISTVDILRGDFTLIGIKTSNSEVRNGAVMYYVMAPVLWAMRLNPLAGAMVQTLLSLATAVVLYLCAKKYFAPQIALLAAFLVATSALLVQFSRQTLLAYYPLFFSALFLYVALRVIEKSNLLFIVFLGIICGVSLQVHYATLALLLCALLLPLLFKKKKVGEIVTYWGSLGVGVLVGFSPMLLFELRHEFFNAKMLLKYLSDSGGSHEGFNILNYLVNSLAQYFFGNSVIITCFVVITLIYILLRVRRSLGTVEKLCLLQIACVTTFLIIMVHENIPHYLLPAVPSIILLSVGLVAKVKGVRWSKLLVVSLAAVFFLLNISHYHLDDTHGWTMTEGWDLKGVEKSSQIIASDVSNKSFTVAMIVDQENQGLPLRYFLHSWGYRPLPVEAYDNADTLYVVAEPGTVLSKVNMWEVTAFGPYEVRKTWPIQKGYLLYKLEKAYD